MTPHPFNSIYYSLLKQWLPRGARLAVRKAWCRYRRPGVEGAWPIDEQAGNMPPGWPGWPQNKRFALVLTHDVEGARGLGKVEQLMSLELKHGFRSAFNFVPEGEYLLSTGLLSALEMEGFEVGVHGLEHDGKLYRSKAGFESKKARIREYLEKWGACGFRSPLMQHRLAWLHGLGLEYDASTFDTDPFEPESDGVQTIFPFWVPGPQGTGYVELPYTLPQDHTVFVVLGEQTIELWKHKLDWIARRGGMALLITHPDYMWFRGRKVGDEYPAAWYEEFLCYVRQNYGEAFWAATPKEVVRYYRSHMTLPNSRKKICMVAYTQYESDNRVRRYAEALAKRGDRVDVIALGRKGTLLGDSEINGVTVHRIQRRERNERHKLIYLLRLFRFLLRSSVFLTRRHQSIQYDIVHIHNVPDFLVFAAWYPKATGAKVILDIHDILPELFASKFNAKPDGVYARLLRRVERASAAFADHVIVSNHLWYDKLTNRSVSRDKCSVFLNHVDPDLFYRRPKTRTDDKIIILFPGTFLWHQGLDIAIRAFALIKPNLKDAEFHLYGGGGGNADSELAALAGQLGLNGSIKFHAAVPIDRIADVIANADLGVVPKRADSFGNEAYSTKIMEFMSQGIPVVVSRTKIDSYYFGDNVVQFFASGDDRDMASAMLNVLQNSATRNRLISGGLKYVDQFNWTRKKKDYFDLVDRLSTDGCGEDKPQVARASYELNSSGLSRWLYRKVRRAQPDAETAD